jgi:hypothetical protein
VASARSEDNDEHSHDDSHDDSHDAEHAPHRPGGPSTGGGVDRDRGSSALSGWVHRDYGLVRTG